MGTHMRRVDSDIYIQRGLRCFLCDQWKGCPRNVRRNPQQIFRSNETRLMTFFQKSKRNVWNIHLANLIFDFNDKFVVVETKWIGFSWWRHFGSYFLDSLYIFNLLLIIFEIRCIKLENHQHGKDGGQKNIGFRSTICSSSLSDQYLPENMEWTFWYLIPN